MSIIYIVKIIVDAFFQKEGNKMEVFTGNIKSITQELKSLEKEILTCQTLSKLVPLLYSYYSFIHIYNVYSHKNYYRY